MSAIQLNISLKKSSNRTSPLIAVKANNIDSMLIAFTPINGDVRFEMTLRDLYL